MIHNKFPPQVMHDNALTEAGYISRMWNTDKHVHTMNIYFADQNLDSITKAIYIATGFLLVRLSNLCINYDLWA